MHALQRVRPIEVNASIPPKLGSSPPRYTSNPQAWQRALYYHAILIPIALRQRTRHAMRRGNTTGTAVLLLLLSACTAVPSPPANINSFEKPISFSILEDYDKGQDLREIEADFLLFRELGITTWRGSFGWDDYEPQRGNYDFRWLHRFAELAASHHIDLRPYVGYTPAWAAKPGGHDEAPWNNPPADIAIWRQFVKRLASAMSRHPNVLSFEIYNEENSPMWWDGSAREYARVLIEGSDAVRAQGDDDEVLLGGLTYPDLNWLEKVCAGAGAESFDILPLHAYPETWPADEPLETLLSPDPEGYFRGTFLPGAEAACGPKPIWINETGFATTPGEKTEQDQANWWARALATFVAEPRVQHIGVYEIKDRPTTLDVIGEPENYHLGLTYPDRRKKLAFYTVQRLVGLLNTGVITVADASLDVEVTRGRPGQMYQHLFIRPDGDQVLVIWDKTGSPTVRITLPRPGNVVTEYALDGSGSHYRQLDGRRLGGIRLQPGQVRMFLIKAAIPD
jgi:hypothetical protein